ncbi:glycosyltransferase family 4 protein [Subtercola boreus]|uniref:Mannosyltransferase n=1 Tax=Subtercola boreus TaxID=120213 RepID=A0A3E0W928_9MICO|nr:glycosyltransferase family 1 protein [Subtercola boreus]RFA18746.1 mannosyltransferase [Subtercola boreus]RFA18863.1 mannosyltransferase [Subtercola boreus]RFA25398.1 mannosyltransferase [Subtercola boreus]
MAGSRRITVNGSFRPQPISGQQRYAREIADRVADSASATEVEPGPWFAARGLRTWAWVMGILPFSTARNVLLTLTSRGPLVHPRHVVVVHDIFVLTNPEWYSKAYVLSHAPLLRAQLRTAKAVVAVSEPVARQVAAAALTKAPIVVAPNAPSTLFLDAAEKNAADVPPVLERLGVQGDSYLLVVGNLDPRKNLERLSRAYSAIDPHLRARFPLVVVGGVNATVFASVGISWPAEVVLAGYVDDAELAVLYRSARGVVFPSLAEGFGLPMVEAAVSGARLAVSDIEIFHWIAGENVAYFDPTSEPAITRALTELVTTDASDGRAFAADIRARFDWNTSARTIAQACRRVAER